MSKKNSHSVENIKSKTSRSGFGKLITLFSFVTVIGVVFSLVFFSTNLISASNSAISNIFPDQNLFDAFKSFIGVDGANLKGKSKGRTNFLIIGKDYGVNTDTIIVLSYFHTQKEFSSISLPRDLSTFDGYSNKKINAIYGDAQSRYDSGNSSKLPEDFLSDFIGDVLNDDIHYWARVDIDGFANVIDTIGGITVDVENSFTDCSFPTPNYQNVFYPDLGVSLPYIRPCPGFEAGVQTMDSTSALIYARSRKSVDNPAEAIDFARNQRQQKVIEASINKIKQDFFNGSILFNSNKVNDLSEIIGDSIQTNMKLDELISLIKVLPEDVEIQRQALDYNGGIICSSSFSSELFLCDDSRLSISTVSEKQRELQNLFANLNNPKNDKLIESSVFVTGNGSDVIPKTMDALYAQGFTRTSLNNVNLSIDIATFNSVENVYIYIPNSDLEEDFKDINFSVSGAKVSYIEKVPEGIELNSVQDINIIIY